MQTYLCTFHQPLKCRLKTIKPHVALQDLPIFTKRTRTDSKATSGWIRHSATKNRLYHTFNEEHPAFKTLWTVTSLEITLEQNFVNLRRWKKHFLKAVMHLTSLRKTVWIVNIVHNFGILCTSKLLITTVCNTSFKQLYNNYNLWITTPKCSNDRMFHPNMRFSKAEVYYNMWTKSYFNT